MTDILTAARRFIEQIPHARDLNMALTELGVGRARITMP